MRGVGIEDVPEAVEHDRRVGRQLVEDPLHRVAHRFHHRRGGRLHGCFRAASGAPWWRETVAWLDALARPRDAQNV
ncbi:serine dehydratase [Ralstonia solanacearum]|nr:serine dehydratase [Ralstonia solanacearum]